MKHMSHTTPTVKNDGRIFRNDLILILALLLCAILAGAAFFFLRGTGDTVTVTVDGTLYGTYPLAVDTEVEIRTGEGDRERNLLIIRGGSAFVAEATCPDGIFVSHRPISRHGESIVCLPHRVTVTVRAPRGDTVPDTVA